MASVGRLFRRKSSEVELSEIFKTESSNAQQNMDENQDGFDGLQLSNGMSERLSIRHPAAPRRSLSAPSPIRLDLNGNEQTGPLTEEDRLTTLEKKVSSQQDEIAILKSALANVLRRLGTVEDNTKRPSKGRMMPSIPTSSAVSQPSALVRPSRHSTGSGPKSPKLEDESSQDGLGYNINMVKGLLKSMRAKSPLPRGVSTTSLNLNQTTTSITTVSSSSSIDSTAVVQTSTEVPRNQRTISVTNQSNESSVKSTSTATNDNPEAERLDAAIEEISPDKPTTDNTTSSSGIDNLTSPTQTVTRPGDLALGPSQSAHARKFSNDSPVTSPTSDVPRLNNKPITSTTHARKLSDENTRKLGKDGHITSPTSDVDSSNTDKTTSRSPSEDKSSPSTSPTREVTSPTNSDQLSAYGHLLNDTSESPTVNQVKQEIVVSPRDTATVRARILSDKTDSRPRSRKVIDQKSKSLERCVSEADLTTTKRQRSKSTIGSSMSLKSPKSSVRRKSSSGGNLQRASSTSSLNIKSDDTSQKQQRDEPTRLYIRGRSLNLYPPSDYVEDKNVGLPPEQKLQLEWVYGYRGRDCRDNLFYIPTGELVYNIAAVVILYNQETGQQRHYLGHNDDVKCIALHPNKLYIASGQVAGHDKEEGRPHVRVWDSVTLETLQVLGIGQFERAIACLAFTIKDEGRHLVVVDESNEHVISYWEWQNKNMITENKGSSDPVLMTICHPDDPAIIVSCGKSHIAFWTLLESGGLMKKMGVYGQFDKPRFVLCMCFLRDGNLLTGDSNGNIFEWPQGTNRINKAIHTAHEGPVFSLCSLDNGGFMSGGGRDRLIVLWSETYQPLKEICLPESAGPVRALARGTAHDNGDFQLAVGTTKNSLLAGSFDEGLTFIATGHTDELWGLAVHPTRRMFVTCGYDKQIMLCSGDNHTVIWKKHFEESLQSAAFHPKAFVLAVGTQSGNWMVLDSITGDQLGAFHDGPEQLDAIKYSPDGNYIAVGSHDNFIYLYTVSEDGRTYRRHGKLSGHSSFVTHVDWSSDSQYLQTNSGDYEILYWHANRCKQVVSAYSMRDIKWETWTCVLGFPACGIWPEGADGTDINACCRSTSSEFMVTGDDFGQVNFFRYPVAKLKSDCQNCLGHSSHVTCVRFTCDDTRVMSTGGKDCSVMQWKIMS